MDKCKILPAQACTLNDIALEESLKNIQTMSQYLFEKYMQAKDELLQKIATQILQREPTIDDAGKFQLMKQDGRNYEVVCYEYNRLGIIKIKDEIEDRIGFPRHMTGWEFIPDPEYTF